MSLASVVGSIRHNAACASAGEFDGVMEWAMKFAANSLLISALIMGVSGAAYAQSGSGVTGGMSGAHFGSANGSSVGTGLGTGLRTGLGTGLGQGSARGAATIGSGLSAGTGAATSNMRANGTSLSTSPDPRAPDVAGTAFAPPR